MRNRMKLALIATLGLGAATAVIAGDKIDWGGNDGTRAKIEQVTQQHGWQLHEIEREHGKYEIEGCTSDGREVEAKLDRNSLQIINIEYDDDDDDCGVNSANKQAAPAGTVAPPQNGLFSGDAAPTVTQQ